jgi:hypothetical protein
VADAEGDAAGQRSQAATRCNKEVAAASSGAAGAGDAAGQRPQAATSCNKELAATSCNKEVAADAAGQQEASSRDSMKLSESATSRYSVNLLY